MLRTVSPFATVTVVTCASADAVVANTENRETSITSIMMKLMSRFFMFLLPLTDPCRAVILLNLFSRP